MSVSYRVKLAHSIMDKIYTYHENITTANCFADIKTQIRQDFQFQTVRDFELVDYKNTERGEAIRHTNHEKQKKVKTLYSDFYIFYIRPIEPSPAEEVGICGICDENVVLQQLYNCDHRICMQCYNTNIAHNRQCCPYCRATV